MKFNWRKRLEDLLANDTQIIMASNNSINSNSVASALAAANNQSNNSTSPNLNTYGYYPNPTSMRTGPIGTLQEEKKIMSIEEVHNGFLMKVHKDDGVTGYDVYVATSIMEIMEVVKKIFDK